MKKLIVLSLVGIGIYLLWTRKAHAEEVSEIPAEIPTTPQAPSNPAISMVDQIIKEIEEKYEIVAPAPAPSEICKQVKFTMFPLPFMAMAIVMVPRIAVETICGPNLKTIQEKAELRAQTIFSPLKATFQILD